MPVDKFGNMSDAKTRDTGYCSPTLIIINICSDGSTPFSGSIDMKGNTLNNVSDPANPQDVATKDYVDKVGKSVDDKNAYINPFPNKPWFLHVFSTSLLKTLRQKEKLLVTSNFSFSHSVFYPFEDVFANFIKFEIVICNLSQFGRI